MCQQSMTAVPALAALPVACASESNASAGVGPGGGGAPEAGTAAAARPFTPDSLPSQAAATPAVCMRHSGQFMVQPQAAPQAAAAAGTGPTQTAHGGGESVGGAGLPADSAALKHGAQCFADRVAGSPLIQSALLWLEATGSHPPPDGGSEAAPCGSLQWTLAQMLAMCLRAGLGQGGCCTAGMPAQLSSPAATRPPQALCIRLLFPASSAGQGTSCATVPP